MIASSFKYSLPLVRNALKKSSVRWLPAEQRLLDFVLFSIWLHWLSRCGHSPGTHGLQFSHEPGSVLYTRTLVVLAGWYSNFWIGLTHATATNARFLEILVVIIRHPTRFVDPSSIAEGHSPRSFGFRRPHGPVARSPTHPASADSVTPLVIGFTTQRNCTSTTPRRKKQRDNCLSGQFDHWVDTFDINPPRRLPDVHPSITLVITRPVAALGFLS